MLKLLFLSLVLTLICFGTFAKSGKAVEDRDLICSLAFGKYENNAFVSSTPMQDACNSGHFESRKRICEYNYKKREIIAACIATYDAVTQQIIEAKAHNKLIQPTDKASAD